MERIRPIQVQRGSQAHQPCLPLQPIPSVNVTTLPDVSSKISTFSGDGGISARRWLEDLERTQQLDSHRSGKTSRTTRRLESHNREAIQDLARMERSFPGTIRRTALPNSVADTTQGESLVSYTLAKLKIIARCPVTLTDQQRLEYVIQGLRDRQVASVIAVQRLSTVSLFMTIVRDVDRTMDHNRSPTTPPALGASAAPNMPSPRPRPSQPFAAAPAPLVSPGTATSSRQMEPQPFAQDRTSQQPFVTTAETLAISPTNAPGLENHEPQISLQHLLPEELPGSKFACMIVPVTVAGVGPVDAFPDSGSKMSIIYLRLVSRLNLLPWNKPPLVVVGGSSVTHIGFVCIRISVGAISGLVEAAVLPQNALPFILGEDWFCASQVELLVRPPFPSQLRHPGKNIIIDCQERLLPRMANAVLLENSALSKSRMPYTPDGLKNSPIFREEQPAMSPLGITAMHIAPCQEPQTSALLPQPAVIGAQQIPDERSQVEVILERHAPLFATIAHARQIKPLHHPYLDETLLEPSEESPPDSRDVLLNRTVKDEPTSFGQYRVRVDHEHSLMGPTGSPPQDRNANPSAQRAHYASQAFPSRPHALATAIKQLSPVFLAVFSCRARRLLRFVSQTAFASSPLNM
ncbi:hypothetical protein HPB47_002343 [Ixodes persulcatus]|uniref:Uncharacterized protein n=1 Tax=Ixodes persulcatus TaxID=34615 RepID=A0AC60PLH4_IXOPE|nr:hypothetical protein HPB47_002343 [Ixodes persulcatus]